MINFKKLCRITGIILMVFALLANIPVIGYLFASTKKIQSVIIKLYIIFFQLIVFLVGASIYLLPRSKINLKKSAYLIYFILLPSALFVLGGFLTLLLKDAESFPGLTIPLGLAILLGLLTAILARKIFRKDGRVFIFSNIYFLLSLIFTLYFSEMIASFFVPPWPAMGLHGVRPGIGKQGWGRVISIAGGMEFNSWGQRDKERKKIPAKGVKRIVFIGDSYLEESMRVPFPVVTEEKLPKDIEIINLGVSATEPDEYYYRLKNIGLTLKPSHCFLFFYSGNDFWESRSLFSFLGIVATYPRDSLFVSLGLKSLNHLLTSQRRPALHWDITGRLNTFDNEFRDKFVHASDKEAENILLSFTAGENREKLRQILAQKNTALIYENLRHPDKGLFRAYIISLAVRSLTGEQKIKPYLPVTYAYSWIKRSYELCAKKKIKFTLVLVPDPASADKRMQDYWLPLFDMAEYTLPFREAMQRLQSLCQNDGIDYIDLYPILKEYPGAYLNLDGHFSEKGTDIVSDVLATHIRKNGY